VPTRGRHAPVDETVEHLPARRCGRYFQGNPLTGLDEIPVGEGDTFRLVLLTDADLFGEVRGNLGTAITRPRLATDHACCGFVAGVHHQEDRRPELAIVEGSLVLGRLYQRRDHVVAGFRPLLATSSAR